MPRNPLLFAIYSYCVLSFTQARSFGLGPSPPPPQKERKRAVPPKSTPDNEKQARSKKSQGKTVQHLRATQVVIVRTRMTTFAQSPFSFSLSLPLKKSFLFRGGIFCARENCHAGRVCCTFLPGRSSQVLERFELGWGGRDWDPNSKKNVKSGRKRLGIGFQISM